MKTLNHPPQLSRALSWATTVTRLKMPWAGVELQYGDPTNFGDGFDTNIFKVQFSFTYNFSHTFLIVSQNLNKNVAINRWTQKVKVQDLYL